MNTENANFTTPKQTKRLGLRRSHNSAKNYSEIKGARSSERSVYSVERSKAVENETPSCTPKKTPPQSDFKINYKHLEYDKEESTSCSLATPVTPKNASSADIQRLAVSTNCRPYRLALSKKVREKMTKKRLEFYLANEIEKEFSEEKQSIEDTRHTDDLTENKFKSREDLLQEIENARKELDARQKHLEKVKKLKEAIAIWKEGFSTAVHDLQEKLEPKVDTATLLQRLNIPQEMIKYIKD